MGLASRGRITLLERCPPDIESSAGSPVGSGRSRQRHRETRKDCAVRDRTLTQPQPQPLPQPTLNPTSSIALPFVVRRGQRRPANADLKSGYKDGTLRTGEEPGLARLGTNKSRQSPNMSASETPSAQLRPHCSPQEAHLFPLEAHIPAQAISQPS